MPALFIAGSVALVLVDQIVSSEPMWSEWWLDLPIAGLLAASAWHWWSSSCGTIDDVVVAVNRGTHDEDVLSSVDAMAAAIDMRDDYTGEHSAEVVRLAAVVGAAARPEREGARRSSRSPLACTTSARSACRTRCC